MTTICCVGLRGGRRPHRTKYDDDDGGGAPAVKTMGDSGPERAEEERGQNALNIPQHDDGRRLLGGSTLLFHIPVHFLDPPCVVWNTLRALKFHSRRNGLGPLRWSFFFRFRRNNIIRYLRFKNAVRARTVGTPRGRAAQRRVCRVSTTTRRKSGKSAAAHPV